jgi:folate-binding protein YgfZ
MPPDYAAAGENAVVFDLSARGKIELAGPDARLFLHNLCTNDVKDLPVSAGCETFLCTAKARIMAHILVGHCHAGEHNVLWIDFEPGMQQKVYNHLNHYLISERVELSDRTNDLCLLRIAGAKARDIIDRLCGARGTEPPLFHPEARLLVPGILAHVRRIPCLSVPGFDLCCPSTHAGAVHQALVDQGATPAGSALHEILRVEAGWPVYGADMDENRFVVEVGRTEQAISYAKGCFLGQEPIVMARDRGHVNRLLSGVKGDAVAAGMRLFKDGNEVGQVTSAVSSPRLGPIGLAYLKRGHWEPGTVLTTAADADGASVTVAALPFISSA